MISSGKWKMICYRLCLGLFVIVASTDLLAANHALLIGIQNYPKTPEFKKRSFDQLSGPLNDIELMEQILSSPPFAFPKNNIKVLRDRQATHSAIEKAFIDLKSRVKPDDFVYIHFSGHGSEAINDNPDDDKETYIKNGKSMDETWVPFGASAGIFKAKSKDDWDIRDDEINVWLAGLNTDRIVFVSDSCQSGSVSRGPKVGVRGIRMDERNWPKGASLPSLPLVGIRIGASGDQEFSYEINQGDKSYGRFTWFWNMALKTVQPGETWGGVFHRTEVLMGEESMNGIGNKFQTPQIDPQVLGERDIKVADGKFTSRDSGIVVAAVANNGREVKLDGGLLDWVSIGSIYRVFTSDKAQTKKAAEAEIISVTPFSSTARIVSGRMQRGDLLVESQHAYAFPPIGIVIEGDHIRKKDKGLKALASQITTALQKLKTDVSTFPDFKIVSTRQEADWIIYLLRPEKQSGKYIYSTDNTLPNPNPANQPEAWVLNTQEELLDDTLRVELGNAEKGVEELANKLQIVAELRDLKSIKNAPPDFRVLVHRLSPDDTCQKADNLCFFLKENQAEKSYRAIDTNELGTLDAKALPSGTKLGFSVENKTDRDYYLYLLNISVRDGAFVQFPERGTTSEAAIIEGGKTKKLPGAIYFPNTGHEIIKALISKEKLDINAFEFAGTADRGATKGQGRGPTSPLERLLNRKARRGKSLKAPEPSEWGTLQAEMVVSERN